MSKKNSFTSALGQNIATFIAEKRACGFKYVSAEWALKSLDKYWETQGYQDSYLTMETLDKWCEMKETEGAGHYHIRLSVTREFSKYLCGLGYSSYIPCIEIRYELHERIPLSKKEIDELFWQIDRINLRDYKNTDCARLSNEYPIIFRLLYLTGMRIEETCSLPMNQYDSECGIITIIDGKGNKDRLVYLADDMNVLCNEYVGYLRRTIKAEPLWLFPGRNHFEHMSVTTINGIFNRCWKKTPSAATRNQKPTVHDLRHTMVVNKINQWVEQGLSFEEMRPYLSTFLGHKTWRETLYYFHYSKEGSQNLHSVDKISKKVIPEVRKL